MITKDGSKKIITKDETKDLHYMITSTREHLKGIGDDLKQARVKREAESQYLRVHNIS